MITLLSALVFRPHLQATRELLRPRTKWPLFRKIISAELAENPKFEFQSSTAGLHYSNLNKVTVRPEFYVVLTWAYLQSSNKEKVGQVVRRTRLP